MDNTFESRGSREGEKDYVTLEEDLSGKLTIFSLQGSHATAITCLVEKALKSICGLFSILDCTMLYDV